MMHFIAGAMFGGTMGVLVMCLCIEFILHTCCTVAV